MGCGVNCGKVLKMFKSGPPVMQKSDVLLPPLVGLRSALGDNEPVVASETATANFLL